jgi:hypothetical protein
MDMMIVMAFVRAFAMPRPLDYASVVEEIVHVEVPSEEIARPESGAMPSSTDRHSQEDIGADNIAAPIHYQLIF